MTLPPIPFKEIAEAARLYANDIVARWIPGGRMQGVEYVVKNPTRQDRKPGSFRINTQTGCWGEFSSACSASGGDLISLGTYLFGWSAVESARRVAYIVGHPFGDNEPPQSKKVDQ